MTTTTDLALDSSVATDPTEAPDFDLIGDDFQPDPVPEGNEIVNGVEDNTRMRSNQLGQYLNIDLVHARTTEYIKNSLNRLLTNRSDWQVFGENIAVRTATHTARIPDIILVNDSHLLPGTARFVEPWLIIEVVSTATAKLDYGLKRKEYLELPTLMHYLVVDPLIGITHYVDGRTCYYDYSQNREQTVMTLDQRVGARNPDDVVEDPVVFTVGDFLPLAD